MVRGGREMSCGSFRKDQAIERRRRSPWADDPTAIHRSSQRNPPPHLTVSLLSLSPCRSFLSAFRLSRVVADADLVTHWAVLL